MPKRKCSSRGPLPSLAPVEFVNGVHVKIGGSHGYLNVKYSTATGDYQGCNRKLSLYTKRFPTAKEAAVALAHKEKDAQELMEGAGKKISITLRAARH